MTIKFLGAAEGVTGSNFLLTASDKNGLKEQALVDCGLYQGSNFAEKHNFEEFAYQPKDIKAVFITHAHIDHTGRLPMLFKQGFRGVVFGTAPTKEFVYELLMDSEDILRKEAEKHNKEALYSKNDVDGVMSLWQEVRYGETVEHGAFKATFKNAGHILGSSSIIIEADGKKIIFSGDLGNASPSIIDAADKITEHVDYCVMESTYGNRLHEGSAESKELLENVIEDTVSTGGVLMIPAFAMERTQRLLYEIDELSENGRIPKVPVFIDSPLAIKLIKIYNKHRDYFNVEAEKLVKNGGSFFDFPGLKKTETVEASKAINDVVPPKIIIAGSGMSNGGRILHHEIRYLSDPKNTILFIGYQAANTLGRQVLDGAKVVRIFGEDVLVRCRVVHIGGYSAHADQKGLLEWLYPMRRSVKKVFLVHGEPDSMAELSSKIKDELAVDVVTPSLMTEVVLE